MKALFLVCALALRPVSFSFIKPTHQEVEQLKEFIKTFAPGAEVKITPPVPLTDLAWERLPFMWNGYWVWIKRRPVYDQKIKESV